MPPVSVAWDIARTRPDTRPSFACEEASYPGVRRFFIGLGTGSCRLVSRHLKSMEFYHYLELKKKIIVFQGGEFRMGSILLLFH
jgi:radical SAM superfamily enzyme YgiQ (UPF0313 family)